MGYFRIFYYITYILNFILRLIKRHGKAILWFICIAVFLVICLYNPKSQAVYIGNDTYTDSQNNVLNAYNSIVLDFIKRYDNAVYAMVNIPTPLQTSLKSNVTSFYFYYGDLNGLSMINGATYNQNIMYVLVYRNDSNYFTRTASVYDDYLGNYADISKYTFTSGCRIYSFSGNSFTQVKGASDTFDVYLPNILFNYYTDEFINYFYNNYTLQEVELLHDMNNKLSQVNQELQSQTDYLTEEPSSDDFSKNDLPTDSGVTATTDSGLNSFFTQIYNGFIAAPNYAQHTIKVPIPFTR